MDAHGTTSIQCDPNLRPSTSQPCSTGISCSVPTEPQIADLESTIAPFSSDAPVEHNEPPIDVMSRDDPSSYRYERSKESLTPYKHQELPQPERLVDQRVPNEAT